MKPKCPRPDRALTLVEVLVMSAVIALMIGVVLPGLNQSRRVPGCRISCVNNLKQVGLSFRIFATDNNDQFPMNISTKQGGSREHVPGGNAFRHFQVMSNELSTPKILVCPEGKRVTATNWSMLRNEHVSYFVGFDSSETEPQTLLSGDRNITNGVIRFGQVLILRTNQPVGWTAEIHKHAGNVALGDGSVQQLTSARLREQIRAGGKPVQRIALP